MENSVEGTRQPMEAWDGAAFEVFQYSASPLSSATPWEAWGPLQAADGGTDPESTVPDRGDDTPPGIRHAACEELRAAEVRHSFDAGRARGIEEGRAAEREAQTDALQTKERLRAEQAVRLVESFRVEQERYLHRVEGEVVRLALAVAARILRREAQMDPLLLTGAVRVALGQLSASTAVRLRVPEAELDLWTESVGLLPNLALKPTVVTGEGMRLGDCAIETELGSVDLGVRAQLAEIERGFFDRAGAAGQTNPSEKSTEVKA